MHINHKYLTAFSPTMPYVCLATKAKLFDDTFSSTSEILVYNTSTDTFTKPLPTLHKFNRLLFVGSSLIVGACENGVLEVYKYVPEKGLEVVYTNSNLLSSDIMGLDYNLAKNMVVCGSSKSKLVLLNVDVFKAYATGILSDFGDVTCVSWNPKVNHILGVGNGVGDLVVLDLRQKKEVMRVSVCKGPVCDVRWSWMKATVIFVVGCGVVYEVELGTGEIKIVCKDAFSIHFLHSNTNNDKLGIKDKKNNDPDSNLVETVWLVCAGKNSIKIYDTAYKFLSEIVLESPIFDFTLTKDFASISYLSNKTEILKTRNLLARIGLFIGNESDKKVFSVVGKRIFSSDNSCTKICLKDYKTQSNDILAKISEMKEKKEYEKIKDLLKKEFYNDKKPKFSKSKENFEVVGDSKILKNDIIVEDKEKSQKNTTNKLDSSIKIDNNDIALSNIIENKPEFTNNDTCEVSLNLFYNLINKEYEKIDFKEIKDTRILFLTSKITGNYNFLIHNTKFKDWYLLCIHFLDSLELLEKLGDNLSKKTKYEKGKNKEIKQLPALICYLLSENIEKYVDLRKKQYSKLIESTKIGNIRNIIQGYGKIIEVAQKNNIDVNGLLSSEYFRYKLFEEKYENIENFIGKNDHENRIYLELKSKIDKNFHKIVAVNNNNAMGNNGMGNNAMVNNAMGNMNTNGINEFNNLNPNNINTNGNSVSNKIHPIDNKMNTNSNYECDNFNPNNKNTNGNSVSNKIHPIDNNMNFNNNVRNDTNFSRRNDNNLNERFENIGLKSINNDTNYKENVNVFPIKGAPPVHMNQNLAEINDNAPKKTYGQRLREMDSTKSTFNSTSNDNIRTNQNSAGLIPKPHGNTQKIVNNMRTNNNMASVMPISRPISNSAPGFNNNYQNNVPNQRMPNINEGNYQNNVPNQRMPNINEGNYQNNTPNQRMNNNVFNTIPKPPQNLKNIPTPQVRNLQNYQGVNPKNNIPGPQIRNVQNYPGPNPMNNIPGPQMMNPENFQNSNNIQEPQARNIQNYQGQNPINNIPGPQVRNVQNSQGPNPMNNIQGQQIRTPNFQSPSINPNNIPIINQEITTETLNNKLNIIQNKINYIKHLALKKQTALSKNRINIGLKRIEIYEKMDKNRLDLNIIIKLENLLEKINEKNIEGMRKDLFTIFKKEAEEIAQIYGEKMDVAVFVPGLIGLVQVITM